MGTTVAVAIPYSYTLALGYSRLIMGSHSLLQVVFGWLLGFWLALSGHLVLRKPIYKFFASLVADKKQLWATWMKINLFYAIFMGIQVGTFLYQKQHEVIPERWLENITKKCPNFVIEKWFLNNIGRYMCCCLMPYAYYTIQLLYLHYF